MGEVLAEIRVDDPHDQATITGISTTLGLLVDDKISTQEFLNEGRYNCREDFMAMAGITGYAVKEYHSDGMNKEMLKAMRKLAETE